MMFDVMGEDFIRMVKVKGLCCWDVVLIYGLCNLFLFVVIVIGFKFVEMLGGVILMEMIFVWLGIGCYMFEVIKNCDYFVI